MTAALQVAGLSATYGGSDPVLRDLDLTLEHGVMAVLGASGCGKTTLLRVIAGFLAPQGGTVSIAGQLVDGAGQHVPPQQRRLGYVPQEAALFPHLTVAENIGFGLPRRERRTSRRIEEMLTLVELPRSLAERAPHELSGGQQQRVAVARALAAGPSLVLLDEPFSSLDAGLREETGRTVVRALQASGAAGVLVTHDQEEALSLADQVAVMQDGRFLQVGTPTQVYLSPTDARVATFLGHAALLPGTVRAGSVGDRVADSALGALAVRETVPLGPALLAVRAEQVQVSADAAHGTAAVVIDVSFFGHDATIRVLLDTGDVITARTAAGDIPAPGDRVGLTVLGDVVAFAEPAR